jgi:hypothetical protein
MEAAKLFASFHVNSYLEGMEGKPPGGEREGDLAGFLHGTAHIGQAGQVRPAMQTRE